MIVLVSVALALAVPFIVLQPSAIDAQALMRFIFVTTMFTIAAALINEAGEFTRAQRQEALDSLSNISVCWTRSPRQHDVQSRTSSVS